MEKLGKVLKTKTPALIAKGIDAIIAAVEAIPAPAMNGWRKLSKAEQHTLRSRGAKANVHRHRWTQAEAAEAGRKGGKVSAKARKKALKEKRA